MPELDKNSPIPLYFQLQEKLRELIEKGFYREGELIPTEKELQKMYSVSRITVRNAINGLVFEGLLVKKQGVGTIVARPKMIENFSSLKSFTEKMKAQGASIFTKVLAVKRITVSERIAKHLEIKPRDEVIYVKRLRFVNSEPIALFVSYIPTDIGVSENDDYAGSIFELFENRLNIRISGGRKVVEAASANKEEAELLKININDPVLLIKNTTLDDKGRPIEYAEGIYRSDRYRYEVKLKR